MKTIQSLRDLEAFGIHCLTGEADNLSFRCLCDVTAKGKKLICMTYGVKELEEPWNSGNRGDPHVASCMLPYDAWRDVGVVALAIDGWIVIRTARMLFGVTSGAFKPAEYNADTLEVTQPAQLDSGYGLIDWDERLLGKIDRIFERSSHPHKGDRNVHAFTGRTV